MPEWKSLSEEQRAEATGDVCAWLVASVPDRAVIERRLSNGFELAKLLATIERRRGPVRTVFADEWVAHFVALGPTSERAALLGRLARRYYQEGHYVEA